MTLYQRILGNPFVYNHVRPLVSGGIDLTPLYRRLAAGPDSVILDVGCGTGDALRYLGSFQRYVGIDTDPIAIEFARREYGSSARVSFECRRVVERDFDELGPTHVILGGLIHHIDDREAIELLTMAQRSRRLEKVVTNDIVYLPREPISNLLARLDRGRFCRREREYASLAEKAGLEVVEAAIERSHPTRGLAKYIMMTLAPRRA
jgi:SAM-dependent methyltransferase